MENILRDILSIHWWFTVFVAGLLISFVSKYTNKLAEDHLTNVGNYLKSRKKAKEESFNKQVQFYAELPERRIVGHMKLTRLSLMGLIAVMLSFQAVIWAMDDPGVLKSSETKPTIVSTSVEVRVIMKLILAGTFAAGSMGIIFARNSLHEILAEAEKIAWGAND